MKHYTVTIAWVALLGTPTIYAYSVASQDSICASKEALALAKAHFPQGSYFVVQSVIWDGNSAVL